LNNLNACDLDLHRFNFPAVNLNLSLVGPSLFRGQQLCLVL